MLTHQDLDRRSLALHQLIKQKIEADPSLFERPKRTLTRWRAIVSADSQPYLEEWAWIFDQGIEVALAVATEESERADALRQCSPFTGILTNEERFAFFREWKRGYAAKRA